MGKKNYELLEHILYHSGRYNKDVELNIGDKSDGATGAPDLKGEVKCLYKGEPFLASLFWWVHDNLCERGTWADGTPCYNWQIAMVAKDILKAEGHWVRDFWWFLAMFALGGGKDRENGMFHINKLPKEKKK